MITFFELPDQKTYVLTRAGEPANFLAAPAPRSQKHPAPAPDYWLSLPKYSFPPQTSKVKRQKNIKQVK